MPGTSMSRPPPAWTLFPSTPTRDPAAVLNMSNPSNIVGSGPPFRLHDGRQQIKPITIEDSNPSFPDRREAVVFDNTINFSSKFSPSTFEKRDLSAIRKEILERPRTSGGLASPISPQLKAHQSSTKIPPRSSSRVEVPDLSVKREQRTVMSATGPVSATTSGSMSQSRSESLNSYHTNGTSLPALQQAPLDENDQLEPLCEDELDPGSFDLVAPPEGDVPQYSLESRSELLFSAEHLKLIFKDPSLFLRFTRYLSSERPSSMPILLYYLDAIKALKALAYSNSVGSSLENIPGFDFTGVTAKPVRNLDLEESASKAFEVMVREDLPAYITFVYIQTVTVSIQKRITGTLPPHLKEASEGLAEVFCLTDPSRPDNPIVFASEEFHRTTQYGMSYVIGKNCRFLQGPKTNPFSVKRLRQKLDEGKEHCEVFLNYRRDGSPFMNLLMMAPLYDSRGTIRYFIGAQVDVSGLVKECSDLESLKRLVVHTEHANEHQVVESEDSDPSSDCKGKFQELSEMLNMEELETVRRRGGRMRQYNMAEDPTVENSKTQNWNKARIHIQSGSPTGTFDPSPLSKIGGQLSGIYENYLLVRPYPSLRILFASPSLRFPGILQSPFMAKIGGSGRIREELTKALADGRGVTAKIRWMASRADKEGRNRWIHCTPLLGNNGAVGVWMVVVVDDEEQFPGRRYKYAPVVDPSFGRAPFGQEDETVSLGDLASGRESALRGESIFDEENRSGSPHTLTL